MAEFEPVKRIYPPLVTDSNDRRVSGRILKLPRFLSNRWGPPQCNSSRVRGLLGIWVSGGEAEGLHFVGVLSFGDEFREDGALGYIQEKFGEALA